MQIIKSDKELALWRYRISRGGLSHASTDDTVVVISFHSTNGDIYPLGPSTSATKSSMLVTLASNSTGSSLLTLAQSNIHSGLTKEALEACPSCRISVVSGPPVVVNADVDKSNNINTTFNQDFHYISKGKILCLGARHPISDTEEFTLSFYGGTLYDTLCTERIVTPNANFIFSPLTTWGYENSTPSLQGSGSRSALILFDHLTADYDGALDATNGLLVDFGGGDTTRTIWGTSMFDLDDGTVTNSLIKREGVGGFTGPYIGLKWGNLGSFSDSTKAEQDLLIRVGTRKAKTETTKRSNGSALEHPLNDYYFKAVSSNVSYSGYFADADGNIASHLEDGAATSLRTGLFVSGTISTTGWSRLNNTLAWLPSNATAFVGRKSGDVYVIKSAATIPSSAHLSSASSTIDSAGGPTDSRTSFWVIGRLNDNAFFPNSAGSIGSTSSSGSSVYNTTTNNTTTNTTSNIGTAATVAFNNIYVASVSTSAVSYAVVQSYNASGLAVNRQTITIPVRAIAPGSSLSSLLTSWASTWVAAKITSVTNSNFYIVESTGTVGAEDGAQVIAVGDYSTDPITINGDLL